MKRMVDTANEEEKARGENDCNVWLRRRLILEMTVRVYASVWVSVHGQTHTHTHTHTHTQRRKKVKIKRFKDGTSSSSVVSVMQIAITHTNTEGQTNRWQMKQTGESSACANEEKTDRPAKLRMMSSPFPSKNSKSILFCSSVKSSTTGTSLDYEREREGEKMLGKGWRCGVRCCRANHVYAHLHRHTQKIGAVHRRAAGRCTHAQNKIIKQGAATGRANSLTKACFFKNRERK